MIKDTSLRTELTFAILPIVIPINPRSGKIVKPTKKQEDATEDPEIVKNRELEREIDPWKKYIVKENLGVSVLENEIRGAFNNSGYYIFLDLPQMDPPQPVGHTLSIESDSYLSSRHFVDMEQFNSESPNKSIVAYLFEKRLLKNTDKGNRVIKSIITYPSKKTVLKVVINKAKNSEYAEDQFEKPILNANLHLRKSGESGGELTPNSMSANVYVFSLFDEIAQIETIEGTYDESNNSILGVRNFIKFMNQTEAKFELVVQLEGIADENVANKFPLEVKIEKAMTTSINVLILE
jgi:hypothetical protein